MAVDANQLAQQMKEIQAVALKFAERAHGAASAAEKMKKLTDSAKRLKGELVKDADFDA
jgi:hypothetical protein